MRTKVVADVRTPSNSATCPKFVGLVWVFVIATLGMPARVEALPRFAARNGMECIQCHISPAGGGMRNAYGRNVFARNWLPLRSRLTADDWVLSNAPPDPNAPAATDQDDGDRTVFDPEINTWLAIGGDLRGAYILILPERGAMPGAKREVTSSFFLMQADLYHSVHLNDHVTAVFEFGAYTGFEAWALYHWKREPSDYDLMLRVGRIMPAFGIREVEHQLYTRERIGLGATDRDTGVELTGYAGPLTLTVSVLNGTFGDTAFDTHGTSRRTFEKAFVSRLSFRGEAGRLRMQLGGSFYGNQGTNQASPLFGGALTNADPGEVGRGVNELRAGGFFTANLGRFTYLADLVWVRDSFYSARLSTLRGYTSYQELSFQPRQGIDLVGTFEFADPDLDILDNRAIRAGGVIEFFPWTFTELRAMVRKTWDQASPTGDSWDFVLFSHLYF
ncbi:MAG: hypothetical protein ACKV2T_34125 [Kofleriaceae bacterium]